MYTLYATTLTVHKAKAIVATVLGDAHSAWIFQYLQ
jgi:hypothetical protein